MLVRGAVAIVSDGVNDPLFRVAFRKHDSSVLFQFIYAESTPRITGVLELVDVIIWSMCGQFNGRRRLLY